MHRTIAGTATAAALATIVVAGLILRLHHLGTESLWLDEAFSITIADSTIDYILETTSEDVHPPLYYFFLYGWVQVLGATEWAGRLYSVAMSAALLITVFALGSRLEGRRVGLVAAGLLAVSPFQVEYAQEARMYAMLALVATLASYCLWRVFEACGVSISGDDRRRSHSATWWAVAYAAFASMLPYIQVHGWFVLAAHGCAVTLEAIRRGRAVEPIAIRWIGAMLAVAAAFLVWLPTFALQVRQVQNAFWIPPPGRDDVLAPFEAYAGSDRLLGLLGALAVIGVALAWRRPAHASSPGHPRPLTLLLPWLVCPILLPFGLSFVGSSIFLPKYTIAASVPFALLAAFGLSRLHRWWHIAAGAVVVALVVSLSLSVLGGYYGNVRKDQWREAVREVERLAQPGDTVIFHPFFTQIPYAFYQARSDLLQAPFPKHAGGLTTPALLAMLDQLLGDHERVWLVLMSFDARKPVLVDALERRFARVERHGAYHIDMYLAVDPRTRRRP